MLPVALLQPPETMIMGGEGSGEGGEGGGGDNPGGGVLAQTISHSSLVVLPSVPSPHVNLGGGSCGGGGDDDNGGDGGSGGEGDDGVDGGGASCWTVTSAVVHAELHHAPHVARPCGGEDEAVDLM